ncbi:MAG: hypothetical protein AAF288_02675 [Planctomycetota bacterium]
MVRSRHVHHKRLAVVGGAGVLTLGLVTTCAGCFGGPPSEAVSTDALRAAGPGAGASAEDAHGLAVASGDVATVAQDPDAAARFAALQTRYLEAAAGDAEALEEVQDGLAALRRDHPADARLAAWMGSSLLLGARDAFLPTTKLALASQGVPLLDEAVRAAPGDPQVRWLRGVSTINLPRIGAGATTAEQGEADLRWVYEHADAAVAQSMITPGQAASTAYHHGRMLERAEDSDAARAAYGRAVELGPGSRSATLAAQRLAELGDS